MSQGRISHIFLCFYLQYTIAERSPQVFSETGAARAPGQSGRKTQKRAENARNRRCGDILPEIRPHPPPVGRDGAVRDLTIRPGAYILFLYILYADVLTYTRKERILSWKNLPDEAILLPLSV